MRKYFLYDARSLLVLLMLTSLLASCGYSRKFTETYYRENEPTLDRIRQNFSALNKDHPFSLELKDKRLSRIGLEMVTDTVKYIYSFNLNEPYLVDTLRKYGYNVQAMGDLIIDLQRAHATWITRLDYYENRKARDMLFIAVRQKELEKFLKPEKYFTLAFFDQPQPVDEKQRLLDRAGEKDLRRFNGDIYRRLRPAVFYAISEMYR